MEQDRRRINIIVEGSDSTDWEVQVSLERYDYETESDKVTTARVPNLKIAALVAAKILEDLEL